jgi:hypothetical protein
MIPWCRFCGVGTMAAMILLTPQGCTCYPEDRVQYLCLQHVMKDGMIGPTITLQDYTTP